MDMKVNRKLDKAPCLDCPDREPGCHGKCEKYQTWLEPIIKAREERLKKNKEAAYGIDRFVRESEKKRKRNGKPLR